MESKSPRIKSQEIIYSTLTATGAPRAVLVSIDQDGQLHHEPVADGQSVLNIETELHDHLSSRPFSTEFLESLMDYCAGRLAARAEAKATGGVSMPRSHGWDIVHVVARGVQ